MHLPPSLEPVEKIFARCKKLHFNVLPTGTTQKTLSKTVPTIEEHYLRLQFICLARMDETSENTGPVEKGSTEIVAVIFNSNMSSLLAKSLATLHSTMTKSFDYM